LNDNVVNVLNIDVRRSLNNWFQHADINVVRDVLNNSLNSWDITIQDITIVGDSVVINVLGTTGVADTIVLS